MTSATQRAADVLQSEPPASPVSRPVAWLRARFRASEIWFIVLAVVVGALAGGGAFLQSEMAHGLQQLLFGIDGRDRLSAQGHVPIKSLIWLPIGGLALGLFSWGIGRWRSRPLVDVVEANALHGGRMSFRESMFICLQTILSNGCGASVGLEAAYAQAGGAIASTVGKRLRLRRHDMRTLVGAGSGAAIGAIFGAPLTGAFYAFEIVIGSYAPSMIAPIAAAALASVFSAQALGTAPYAIDVAVTHAPTLRDYLLDVGLGLICAVVGVGVMRLTGEAERLMRWAIRYAWLRPAIGGCILAGLAVLSTQTLSAGHGALHFDMTTQATLEGLAFLFVLKAIASIVSLGSGFRGGLFFASLFLGSLAGEIYALLIAQTGLPFRLEPEHAALIGMGAMGTAIVGGPLTMSLLVLETTGDFGVTAATLAASLVAGTIVRERFGYSFSTWRLHLRGETIRSARDVGWIRSLTAGRMMRRDSSSLSAESKLAEFRRRFPLGSTTRVIVIDGSGRYAGIIPTERAYVDGADLEKPIADLALNKDIALSPDMNIEQVMEMFDRTESEELAVVDKDGRVLGLLSEVYVSKRYARELQTVQRGIFGEAA